MIKRAKKTELKANLLDDFMRDAKESSIKRDYRLLADKYVEIEPDFKRKKDPQIDHVLPRHMCQSIRQALDLETSYIPVRLSECPTLTEMKESGVRFGRKSISTYEDVMEEYDYKEKLI